MVMGRRDHKKLNRPLCVCGCGKQVKKFRSKYIQGHYSRSCIGEKNSFYGKRHSEFARQSISASLINRANRNRSITNVHDNKNTIVDNGRGII